jgi:hypothetical protein
LGILIAPLARDPHLQWLYFGLAVIAAVAGVVFYRMFKHVDDNPSKELEGTGEYELMGRANADDDGYYSDDTDTVNGSRHV